LLCSRVDEGFSTYPQHYSATSLNSRPVHEDTADRHRDNVCSVSTVSTIMSSSSVLHSRFESVECCCCLVSEFSLIYMHISCIRAGRLVVWDLLCVTVIRHILVLHLLFDPTCFYVYFMANWAHFCRRYVTVSVAVASKSRISQLRWPLAYGMIWYCRKATKRLFIG